MVAAVAWAVFGAWALFRPNANVAGLDPIVGHVVVFFFAGLATLGLLLRPLGTLRAVLVGVACVSLLALVSELLQPVLTETRRAQQADFIGNVAGILGAVVVTALLVGVIRSPMRREIVTAALCVFGLVGSVAAIAGGAERVRAFLDCRGSGIERIDDVAGGPVILVLGTDVRIGNNPTVSLGDGTISDDSTDLRCSVLGSSSYSIVATVTPESVDSGGPTRIFTSSMGTELSQHNTHIGQDFDQLSLRIRSGDGRQWESIPDVFEAGERVTVAVAVAAGRAEVYVDGEWREGFELEGESFVEWDPSYPMLIGDEFTRNRTFEGDIEAVSFFDRTLDRDTDVALLAGSHLDG